MNKPRNQFPHIKQKQALSGAYGPEIKEKYEGHIKAILAGSFGPELKEEYESKEIKELGKAIGMKMREMGTLNDKTKNKNHKEGEGNKFYEATDMDFVFNTRDGQPTEAKMNVYFYPNKKEIFVLTKFPDNSPTGYKSINETYSIVNKTLKVTLLYPAKPNKQIPTIEDAQEIRTRLKELNANLGHFLGMYRKWQENGKGMELEDFLKEKNKN